MSRFNVRIKDYFIIFAKQESWMDKTMDKKLLVEKFGHELLYKPSFKI